MSRSRGVLCLAMAGLLLAGCVDDAAISPPRVESPAVPSVGAPGDGADAEADMRQPAGSVRVAVPEAPTSWLPLRDTPATTGDLAALWGLPLYHFDAAGQPRPALVEATSVDQSGREITVRLRPGDWSDGEPVTANDLAATVAALAARDDPTVSGIEAVEVVDDHEARVVLDAPTRTWPGMLGRVGVLPAHRLAEGGLEAAGDLAVTGGPFRLDEQQPGLRAGFVAHTDGPLGSPSLERVDAVVVPSFDAALGLLRDDELDAIVGHLAIRPEVRVAELEGGEDRFETSAPFGGTSVVLRWGADTGVAAEARHDVARTIRPQRQVQALDLGTTAVSFVPGLPGVERQSDRPAPPGLEEVDGTLTLRREQEMLSLTASLLEAQVRGQDGRLRVEAQATPDDVRRAGEFDAVLTVRRDGPWTPLVSWTAGEVPPAVVAGDRTLGLADPGAIGALETLEEQAWQVPLYRPRVAHVWRAELRGLAPSAWPGAGFTSASRWQWDDSP